MSTVKQRFFLDAADSIVVVVDVQERLAPAVDQQACTVLKSNTALLLDSATELNIPVILTEQYVKGLGETIAELREKAGSAPRLEKLTFSCCGNNEFLNAVKNSGKHQVVVTGMETHVCVLQTVLDLLDAGYVVHLVQDAVASRTEHNRQVGLGIARQAGAVITCTEAVVFEWLKIAGTDSFKKLSKLIK